MAAKKPVKTSDLMTVAELADLLDISQTQFKKLQEAGVIPRQTRGAYSVRITVRAYVHYLRDQRTYHTRGKAESRVKDARAREIEQRMAIAQRVLIPITDADEAMDAVCGMIRIEGAGLPARCFRDLPSRQIVEREVNGSLGRIATRLRQVSGALRQGKPLAEAIAEDDAGSVGA